MLGWPTRTLSESPEMDEKLKDAKGDGRCVPLVVAGEMRTRV